MAWLKRCVRQRIQDVLLLSLTVTIFETLFVFYQHTQPFTKQRRLELNNSSYVTLVSEKDHNVSLSQLLTCTDPENRSSVQDTLCLTKFNYLPQYKNPCFVDCSQELQKLCCLPYFHILGVDKSGTTDLHSRLAKHPHVLLNKGTLGKETYYWCWLKYGQWMRSTSKPQSFSYYIRMFDNAAVLIANDTDKNGFHHLITGDGTPMDFWDFRAWPLIPQNDGLSEPVVLTPHLMRHVYLHPKFIIILRNPVDRLYSDYIFLGYGFTPSKFHADALKAVTMMETCLRINTIRQCVFSNETYVNLPMRLHIGMYSVFMKEWLSVFSRSSFYILRTEDYSTNMIYHLHNIFAFLDLDQLSMHTMQEIVTTVRKHETKFKKKVEDMFPETRVLLQSFYYKYNKELALMLSDDRFLWLTAPS